MNRTCHQGWQYNWPLDDAAGNAFVARASPLRPAFRWRSRQCVCGEGLATSTDFPVARQAMYLWRGARHYNRPSSGATGNVFVARGSPLQQ